MRPLGGHHTRTKPQLLPMHPRDQWRCCGFGFCTCGHGAAEVTATSALPFASRHVIPALGLQRSRLKLMYYTG